MDDSNPLDGFDPAQLQAIQGLLGQFQPTQADLDKASSAKWLALGAGLLGAQKGVLGWRQAGNALMDANNAYQESLRYNVAQRGQNLTQAAQMAKMMKDMQLTNMGLGLVRPYLNGGNAGNGGAAGGGQVAMLGAPETGQSGTNTVPASSAGYGPGVSAAFGFPYQRPPVSAPLTTASSSPPPAAPNAQLGGAPPWANPRMQLGLAAASGDFKKMADVVHEQMQLTVGPDGTLIRNGQMVGRATPQGTIVYQNGDPSQSRFYRNPQDAMDALVQQTGATKEAEARAGATVQTGDYTLQSGQKVPVNQLELSDYLSGKGPVPNTLRGSLPDWVSGAAKPPNASGQNAGLPPPATGAPFAQQPQPSALATNAAGNNPFAGPDPVAQAAAQEFAKQTIDQGSKQLQEFQTKRPMALNIISGLDNMERADQRGVFNGPAQNRYMTAAIWINSMFPGANLDVNKITDSQSYDSALQGLARAGLKSFGGRTTNTEFMSVLNSMPSRMNTPEARAQMREMIGRAALDELNQVNSAERYWNPKTGLTGWSPPSPISDGQYWQSRMRVMNLQPSPNLNTTARYQVQQVLKAGRPQDIRELVLSGVLQ